MFFYYPVYGLLYLFSLLPLRVLFLFSDFAYLLVYYVIGYRKEVVMSNLGRAFPEKSPAEVRQIARKFYRNFTDNFIETLKLLSATRSFVNRHFECDVSILDRIYNNGTKCHILLGHNFNWEITNQWIAMNSPYPFLVVYMPVNSRVFEKIMYKIRSRRGTYLLKATEIRTAMLPYRNMQYLLALVADQNAGKKSNAYWIPFFGTPVPFVKGPDDSSRRGNIPVVYCRMVKKKRGYYRAILSLAEENPGGLPPGAVIRNYVNFLENAMREDPEMWLWSHRRWKHEWKEEYGEIIP